MTNMIQFPKSTSYPLLVNGNQGSQFSALNNSGFNNLFSTLLADMSSLSGAGESASSSSSIFSPVMTMLINKIFGQDAAQVSSASSAPQGNPVNGVITQYSHEGHIALDFGVPVGTNIKSTMSGKVTFAGWNNEGYGNLVIVENGAYKTYYAHLSGLPLKTGQTVKEGDVVGLSGNTGNSTGPHLHYEIRKNGAAINPLTTIG